MEIDFQTKHWVKHDVSVPIIFFSSGWLVNISETKHLCEIKTWLDMLPLYSVLALFSLGDYNVDKLYTGSSV